MQKALITGAAGFIGSHLVDSLLAKGWQITALDNFESFYPQSVKLRNIEGHYKYPGYQFVNADIRKVREMRRSLSGRFDVIVHLAARAGVLPSIDDPLAYHDTNVVGTQNLLDLAREWAIPSFVFASSSSVYGVNENFPWSEQAACLRPISPYACTKLSGELLGHTYSHLYGIRFTALRLFTVFGPRQRPDLAIHKFASLMKRGCPIPIYGDGGSQRDYTYVSDITAGIEAAMSYSKSRFDVFNLGNNKPIRLLDLVKEIGMALGVSPILDYRPAQPGDVVVTCASIRKAGKLLGYRPQVSLHAGLEKFADWFQSLPSADLRMEPALQNDAHRMSA